MRYLLLSFCLLLEFGNLANAQGVATFYYQRGSIAIDRKQPPVLAPLPWQGADAPRQQEGVRLRVDVDIRPATSLYRQEGWVNMGGLSDTDGMLFIFDTPEIARISHMEFHQPLDVLWVDATGEITSIAPSLAVSEIADPILDPKPAKALLLMVSGMCERAAIRPGDRVVSPQFFQPPPSIMTAPE